MSRFIAGVVPTERGECRDCGRDEFEQSIT